MYLYCSSDLTMLSLLVKITGNKLCRSLVVMVHSNKFLDCLVEYPRDRLQVSLLCLEQIFVLALVQLSFDCDNSLGADTCAARFHLVYLYYFVTANEISKVHMLCPGCDHSCFFSLSWLRTTANNVNNIFILSRVSAEYELLRESSLYSNVERHNVSAASISMHRNFAACQRSRRVHILI